MVSNTKTSRNTDFGSKSIGLGGFTLLELLIVIAIISILAANLFPVLAQVKVRAKAVTDATNMKQLYLAVNLYEADFDDKDPAALPLVLDYALSQQVYNSTLDPRQLGVGQSGWNPTPCVPPDDAIRTSYRISYPYLRASMPEDSPTNDRWDYYYWRQTPGAGMLAYPWVGQIESWNHDPTKDSDYGPVMKGAIYRINMDGSFYVLPSRKYDDCLGACTYDLFFNRG